MSTTHLLSTAVGLVGFAALAGTADADHGRPAYSEFDEASVIVEQNITDGDTEIVITAQPDTDQGLTRFSVLSPYRRQVLSVRSPRRARGLREFQFETPEPSGEAILSAYPEGEYTFFGIAEDGERFRGKAELSHELPGPAVIVFPAAGQVVSPQSLTIQWSSVPEAVEYLLEFENESADPEQSLTLNLPPDVTSFDVPASLLVPEANYQVAIASVAENGNIVVFEVEFSTAGEQ